MEGINPIGIVERVERRSETRFSCFGRLEGLDGSLFILVREKDALALFVAVPMYEATFDLRYVKDGIYAVVRIGEEPPCGNHERMSPPSFEPTGKDAKWTPPPDESDLQPAGEFAPTACVQPHAVLDVAVYYTTQAITAIGGVDQMNARIQLFIDQCNTAYNNSLVPLTARLVRRLEVDYPDEGGGNSNTQLDQLTNPSDGVLDNIPPDRTNYRADQVVLLVHRMDGACGVAWCGNGNDPDRAYGVVQWNCTEYSFPPRNWTQPGLWA